MLARSLLCSSCLSPLSLHFPDTLPGPGRGSPTTPGTGAGLAGSWAMLLFALNLPRGPGGSEPSSEGCVAPEERGMIVEASGAVPGLSLHSLSIPLSNM